MELKRILAKDLRAATEKAVSLFGPEALVVSHEQVNGQTEVIVAVDLEPKFDPYAEITQAPPEVIRASATAPGKARVIEPEDFKPAEFRQVFERAEPSIPKTSVPERSGQEPMSAQGDDRDRLRAREIVDLVRQEMAVLRREIRLQQRMGPWASAGLTPLGQQLDPILESLGAPTAMRALLVDEIQSESTAEAALKKAQEILKAGLSCPQVVGPLQGLHVLMGPSGAGKTQMVARLAQQAVEAWGAENVAVISWSDTRLGAWAQIQMACAKLGIDCFRIHEAGLLAQMRQELADRQCIIIDTPGVALASHAERLSSQLPTAQFHLVLPADTSSAQANRLLPLRGWASLMLTKLDEACQSWGLLQALSQHPVPLYATAAQGPALSSVAPMNAPGFVRLAIHQLRDQLAQDNALAGANAEESTGTMEPSFQPTYARLAPKAER